MTQRFSFNNDENKREIAAVDFSRLIGNFLVAAPYWIQSPFSRTVVLVLQQNDQGVFGVIVNRPADADLKKTWMMVSGSEAAQAERLHVGGPIGGPIFALHSLENFAEIRVDVNLYISANSEAIHKIMASGDPRYRIFCGMMSWHPQVLAAELAHGLWFPLEQHDDLVFPQRQIEWEQAVVEYGRLCLTEMLGGKPLAGQPELN